jgi:hypothetical protein
MNDLNSKIISPSVSSDESALSSAWKSADRSWAMTDGHGSSFVDVAPIRLSKLHFGGTLVLLQTLWIVSGAPSGPVLHTYEK